MRKIFTLIIFSGIVLSATCQDQVAKITKTYFRSDPFSTEFSTFLDHLFHDPTLMAKLIKKRTDSTLFYFHGTYASYNPFFFKPKRVKILLNEVVVDRDSLTRDTIYNYQLYAYNDNTKTGIEEVKKEFEKIYRHYKNDFSTSELSEHQADTNPYALTYNFFDSRYAIAPFAVSWFGPDTNNEIGLVLTIRMTTYMNQAILPLPFYTLQ